MEEVKVILNDLVCKWAKSLEDLETADSYDHESVYTASIITTHLSHLILNEKPEPPKSGPTFREILTNIERIKLFNMYKIGEFMNITNEKIEDEKKVYPGFMYACEQIYRFVKVYPNILLVCENAENISNVVAKHAKILAPMLDECGELFRKPLIALIRAGPATIKLTDA
jgi:hypothetical protein